MSTILGIQTFPAGSAALARHWPYFLRAGADEIICITTNDGQCVIPEGAKEERAGTNSYIAGKHLPMRLVRSFEILLQNGNHDWLCVAEYDVLIIRPLPINAPLGIIGHLAGGKPHNCHCNLFVHGPWLADRATAKKIVDVGIEILETNEVDPSPDCFLGQIIERGKIPFHGDILKSYSRNTINEPGWILEARVAIANGAVSIHGIKTKAVLDAIIA